MPTSEPRRVLAVDTSTASLGLAVSDREELLAELTLCDGRKHTGRLLSEIERLLDHAGLGLHDIDGFAATVGPGSFTGVRTGLVTVRTLAWTLGRPLCGRNTLEVLAGNLVGRSGLAAPILDARKKEVYLAVYRIEGATFESVVPPAVLPPDAAAARLRAVPRVEDEPIWVLGDGAVTYPEAFAADALPGMRRAEPLCDVPRAGVLAQMAYAELGARGWEADPQAAAPVYVRPSEAELGAARAAGTAAENGGKP